MRRAISILTSVFMLILFCMPVIAPQEIPIQVQVTVLPENIPPPPPPPPLPPPENVAQFVIENLKLSKDNALPGENVTVQVTVKNVGTADGQHTLVLRVDNNVVDNLTVYLAAGQSTTVSFTVSILQLGPHTISVDNLSAILNIVGMAQFRLENLSISKSALRPGETFSVQVSVVNFGTIAGSYNVILRLNGTQIDNRQVELNPGQSATVTFSLSIQQIGTHTVSVDGFSRIVTVSEEVAEFAVENLRLSKNRARPGEQVTASVDVANVGTISGSYTLTLKIDGVQIETREVLLAAGQRTTVDFTVSVEEPGEHTISVDGLSSLLIVEKPKPFPTVPVVAVVSVIVLILIIAVILKFS
ncbi:MAG: CARDB domain-containing protein [Candidatus Hadarchaeales archaeon]